MMDRWTRGWLTARNLGDSSRWPTTPAPRPQVCPPLIAHTCSHLLSSISLYQLNSFQSQLPSCLISLLPNYHLAPSLFRTKPVPPQRQRIRHARASQQPWRIYLAHGARTLRGTRSHRCGRNIPVRFHPGLLGPWTRAVVQVTPLVAPLVTGYARVMPPLPRRRRKLFTSVALVSVLFLACMNRLDVTTAIRKPGPEMRRSDTGFLSAAVVTDGLAMDGVTIPTGVFGVSWKGYMSQSTGPALTDALFHFPATWSSFVRRPV
jgi:hypothetical protein